jgi:hypothetical protein
MWYCVIDCQSLRLLYHGQDRDAANAANHPDAYLVANEQHGPAMRKAAIGVGYLRRGLPVPDIRPRERGEE